jgi:hypothetical protein
LALSRECLFAPDAAFSATTAHERQAWRFIGLAASCNSLARWTQKKCRMPALGPASGVDESRGSIDSSLDEPCSNAKG